MKIIKPMFEPWHYSLSNYIKGRHLLADKYFSEYYISRWEYFRWTIEHFFGNIREVVRWIKRLFVRGLQGYADCDLWSLDDYYLDLFINSITELKEIKHGYPCDCWIERREKCNCDEKWNKVMDTMIEGFKAGNRYLEDMKEEDKEKFDEAMKLFHEYFFALWD